MHIDPYSIKVDRWSAIHNFLTCLLAGEYPYAAQTHLGGYGSPFPVWQLFHLPFYLLGNVGLSLIVAVIIFAYSVWLLVLPLRRRYYVYCLWLRPFGMKPL